MRWMTMTVLAAGLAMVAFGVAGQAQMAGMGAKAGSPMQAGAPTAAATAASTAVAQAAATRAAGASAAAPSDAAKAFDSALSDVEKLMVGVAERMPADKYNFAPTAGKFDGVRTFAEQVDHIIGANYRFYSGFDVEKPTVDMAAINKLTAKDDIVKALKESFAYAHKATLTITPENMLQPIKMFGHSSTRASVAILAVGHTEDIYGQLVEYLRMNGLVPPASDKPSM